MIAINKEKIKKEQMAKEERVDNIEPEKVLEALVSKVVAKKLEDAKAVDEMLDDGGGEIQNPNAVDDINEAGKAAVNAMAAKVASNLKSKNESSPGAAPGDRQKRAQEGLRGHRSGKTLAVKKESDAGNLRATLHGYAKAKHEQWVKGGRPQGGTSMGGKTQGGKAQSGKKGPWRWWDVKYTAPKGGKGSGKGGTAGGKAKGKGQRK